MGRHHDNDGDGLADQLDDQSKAYRFNENPTTDEEIEALALAGGVQRLDFTQPRPVEDFEAANWDSGREDPPVKT